MLKLTSSGTIPPNIALKPTARPRFHRGSSQDALIAAARASLFHNKPYYIEPTAYGLAVGDQQPPRTQPHIRVMGRDFERYDFSTGDESNEA